MIKINIEKALENAEKLKRRTSSCKMFMDSLVLLKPTRDNWIRKLISLVLEIFAAFVISNQVNTIAMTKEITSILMTILVALIAIVFTGYAFFQALINDELLIALLSVEDEKKGNLLNTNKYFAEVMEFQLFCLLLDLVVVVMTIIVPKEWVLLSNNNVNEMISTVLISFVFYCNVEGAFEMRSFIFNVFQLFNLHAYARLLEITKRGEES